SNRFTLFPYTTLFRSVFNGFQILIKNNQLKKIIHSDDMIIMVLNNGKTITERTLSHEDIEILTNEHSDPVNKIKMLLGVIESSKDRKSTRLNSSHVSI